jgi:uncharacterized protein (TIGR03067 family)
MTITYFVSMPVVASWTSGKKSSDDMSQIQGEWRVVSFDDGRKKEFDWLRKVAVDTILVVKDDAVTVKDGQDKLKIKLDSSRSPKSIDIMAGSLTYEGIYKLEEKSFKLCIANRTNVPRPTKFETKEGGEWLYVELKRENKDQK